MSKNFVRQYEDGFFDEDELEGVERLRHHTKREKEIEKEQTIRRKKNRREKEIELDPGEV